MAVSRNGVDELLKRLCVDADAHRNDKDVSKESIRVYINCLLDLLKFIKESQTSSQTGQGSPDVLKEVLPSLVITVSAHTGRHYWTNRESRKTAINLLNNVLVLCGCKSISEFLLGVAKAEDCLVSPYSPIVIHEDEEENTDDLEAEFEDPLPVNGMAVLYKDGILKELLIQLKQNLRKDNWKSHPNSKQALIWCIKHLKHSQVDSFIDDFLPPLLMLIDDHESYHRSLGLSGMTHMIESCNSSVLRWYNRSEVIYDAIKHLIHTNDVMVINSLHPCLLILLPILNGPPPVSIDAPQKPCRTDEVFSAFLGCMEMESKVVVRKAYSSFLSRYISLMNIFTIRYLKRILSVIYSYIEYPDYSGEETRLNSLQSLTILIKHCWPRIPHHSHEIFKHIVKLISDLSPDESVPDKSDVKKLIPFITNCLLLLLQLCCDIKTSFEEILVNDHNFLHKCIYTALEEFKLKQ